MRVDDLVINNNRPFDAVLMLYSVDNISDGSEEREIVLSSLDETRAKAFSANSCALYECGNSYVSMLDVQILIRRNRIFPFT